MPIVNLEVCVHFVAHIHTHSLPLFPSFRLNCHQIQIVYFLSIFCFSKGRRDQGLDGKGGNPEQEDPEDKTFLGRSFVGPDFLRCVVVK
jgi:hypothetical protein